MKTMLYTVILLLTAIPNGDSTKLGTSCQTSDACPRNAHCGKANKFSDDPNLVCVCDSQAFKTSNGTCEPKEEYGGKCLVNEHCNENNHLICANGTCICGENLYHNSTSNQCLPYVGSECGAFTGKKCVAKSFFRGEVVSSQISGLGKVKAGICECEEKFFPLENHTCEKMRMFGENTSIEITSRPGMTCDSGKCKCSENDTFYESKRNICSKKLGSSCHSGKECPSVGTCIGAKCVCQSEYDVPDRTKQKCVGGNQARCNESLLCSSEKGLICRDGKCQCRFLNHRYFDYEAGKCSGLVGAPCNNKTLDCISNAVCVREGKFKRKVCRCDNDFIAVDKKCDLRFGEKCSQNLDVKGTARCDRLGPLYCINGTCQCGSRQYYHPTKLRCKGLIGSKCNTSERHFCIDYALCQGVRAADPLLKEDGESQCNEGYEENESCWCLERRRNYGNTTFPFACADE